MWIEILIVTSSVVGGFVFGRIYGSIGGYSVRSVETTPEEPAAAKPADSPSREKVFDVARRLKKHAESMAASVDAHQTKIQAVNNSLLDGDQASAEDVVNVVNDLIEANKNMQRQLADAQNRIHEQSMELESAERRAETDSLTRVPNRRAFDRQLKELHDKGPSSQSTLVLMDIDFFKKFNDLYGHLAGDEVLRVVAGLVHSRLNQYGMVARYGGEEFAVIFEGTPIDDVKQFVEETRYAISQRETEFENKCLRVTASFGVAALAGDETIEEWIQRADAGLYASKEAGRNCTHLWKNEETILIDGLAPAGSLDAVKSGGSGSQNATGGTGGGQVKLPSSFDGIASREVLNEEYAESFDRLDSELSVFILAIRHHQPDEAAMESLLPVVRSTLRAVDHLGYADASTLLVVMPSVEEATAMQFGAQICRSAATIGMAMGGGIRTSGHGRRCPSDGTRTI